MLLWIIQCHLLLIMTGSIEESIKKIKSWPSGSQHQPLNIESGLRGDNTGWVLYMKTTRAFFEVIKNRKSLKICIENTLENLPFLQGSTK